MCASVRVCVRVHVWRVCETGAAGGDFNLKVYLLHSDASRLSQIPPGMILSGGKQFSLPAEDTASSPLQGWMPEAFPSLRVRQSHSSSPGSCCIALLSWTFQAASLRD